MLDEIKYLWACLGEEGSEISKESFKGIRFGLDDRNPKAPDKTNFENMRMEVADLMGVVSLLRERGIDVMPDTPEFTAMIIAKREKVLHYMQHSRNQGCLEPKKAE